MSIALTAIESFPIYAADHTSHDEEFGTLLFILDNGEKIGQLRVPMAMLNLNGATLEEVKERLAAAVEAKTYLVIEASLA